MSNGTGFQFTPTDETFTTTDEAFMLHLASKNYMPLQIGEYPVVPPLWYVPGDPTELKRLAAEFYK